MIISFKRLLNLIWLVSIFSSGGVLAQGTCETAGEYLSVPYAADYLFVHKG
jgi:hypothetical protein